MLLISQEKNPEEEVGRKFDVKDLNHMCCVVEGQCSAVVFMKSMFSFVNCKHQSDVQFAA